MKRTEKTAVITRRFQNRPSEVSVQDCRTGEIKAIPDAPGADWKPLTDILERAARAAIGFGTGQPYAGRLLFCELVDPGDSPLAVVWMVAP